MLPPRFYINEPYCRILARNIIHKKYLKEIIGEYLKEISDKQM